MTETPSDDFRDITRQRYLSAKEELERPLSRALAIVAAVALIVVVGLVWWGGRNARRRGGSAPSCKASSRHPASSPTCRRRSLRAKTS